MFWRKIRELLHRRRQLQDDERTLESHNAINRTASGSPTLPSHPPPPSAIHQENLVQYQPSLEFPSDYLQRCFPEHNSRAVEPVHQHNRFREHTVAEELYRRTHEATVSHTLQPSSVIASVQLCPHDTLAFERAQRLADFIGGGRRSHSHPALLSDRNGDHSAGPYRLCKPVPGFPNLIRGDIQYHVFTPEFFNLKGLFVISTWVINLRHLKELEINKEDFRDLLSQSRIELCAHQKLADPWAFGEIYQMASSSKGEAQPSARFGEEERPTPSNLTCERCHTKIKILDRGYSIDVQAVRYLGKGKSETDPLWLAQCKPTNG
ncbi:hypothetical protein JMJ35_001090 [Cladonia borealis]|uniref:Uncharacterized protein n=1 Tax=Cladonia borealis TaxID=184061 RepID=A0AA39R7Q9_9LECA|nr:hypothetical protein JMJ35_001090 [Cladonia borealis]